LAERSSGGWEGEKRTTCRKMAHEWHTERRSELAMWGSPGEPESDNLHSTSLQFPRSCQHFGSSDESEPEPLDRDESRNVM
jgi:hypothetical protein